MVGDAFPDGLLRLNRIPCPAADVPVSFPGPDGLLKNELTAFLTLPSVFINHSTMKSAIIAVTKSAYATFHAPP